MTDEQSLATIGECLTNVAGLIAERGRQAGQGGKSPFLFFNRGLDAEADRLRRSGFVPLAAAIGSLRDGATDNG